MGRAALLRRSWLSLAAILFSESLLSLTFVHAQQLRPPSPRHHLTRPHDIEDLNESRFDVPPSLEASSTTVTSSTSTTSLASASSIGNFTPMKSTGAIVGGAVGGVVIVFIIAFAVVYCLRRRRVPSAMAESPIADEGKLVSNYPSDEQTVGPDMPRFTKDLCMSACQFLDCLRLSC